MHRRRLPLVASLALLLSTALAAPPAAAQPARGAAAGADGALREQTVYVPYGRLNDVFEKEGRGVFLPYAAFLDLWKRAIEPRVGAAAAAPPPTALVVSRATYAGAVEDGVVRISAQLDVTALAEGWAAVPLPFGTAALTDVRVQGDALVLGMLGGVPHVVARRAGSGVLGLELLLPLETVAGERTFTFTPPPVPAARLTLRIPEPDARVAADPPLPVDTAPAGPGGTLVTVALGSADRVALAWRARPQAATAAQPLTFVTAATRVTLGEGAVASETTLEYRILQAPVDRFRVALPPEGDLTAVDGDDVRDWRVSGGDGDGAQRVLTVELREKVKGAYRLSLSLERPVAAGEARVLVPAFRDLDARRQDGWVAVVTEAGVKVTLAEREGAHQVDATELPEALAAPDPALSFRHLAVPFTVTLVAAAVEPRVTAELRTLAVVDDERITLETWVGLEVERAGVFRVRLALPDGLDVRAVAEGPAHAGLVDDFHVGPAEDGPGRVLTMRLAQRQLGAVGFPVVLERPRAADELELDLPFPHVLDVERERGLTGVAVRDRFRARTLTRAGLEPVDVRALAAQGVDWTAPEQTSLVMAWRHEGRAAGLRLGLEQRDPKVVAAVETQVAIHEDVAKVTATVRWDVRFAGVDTLRFTLPSALDAQARIEGESVKERTPARDAQSGLTTWTVHLQRELEGEVPVVVSWERPLEGGEATVAVAELTPLDVDRTSGWFAIVKSGNIEIRVATQDGLEPIDAKELPAALRGAGIFQAFKYHAHPYALSLQVTRHAYEPVLQALADVALLETVIAEERTARTELALLLQSNQRQYLELVLPERSEVLTAFVDGRMVRPARREDGTLLLEMPRDSAGGDRRFVTRLVYQTQLADSPMGWWGGLGLTAPKLPGVPVSILLWRAWVPRDYRWFAPGGSMHEVRRSGAEWQSGTAQLLPFVPDLAGDVDLERSAAAVVIQAWDENDGALRSGEAAATGALPIQVQLVRQGIARDFSKLDGDGTLSFAYVDADVFVALAVLLFVLGLGAAVLLARHPRLRGRRPQLAAVLVGVPLVAGWFTSDTAATLLSAFWMGALAVAIVWALVALGQRALAWGRVPDGAEGPGGGAGGGGRLARLRALWAAARARAPWRRPKRGPLTAGAASAGAAMGAAPAPGDGPGTRPTSTDMGAGAGSGADPTTAAEPPAQGDSDATR
jgi:hypothetical protein